MKTVMIGAMLMGLIGAGTCGGGEEAAEPQAEAQAAGDEAAAEQAAEGLKADGRFDPVSVKKINQDLHDLKQGVQQKADDRAGKLDTAAGQ